MSSATTAQPLTPRRPVLLIILDGFGCNPSTTHNAIHAANTPTLDALLDTRASTTLQSCGEAVGLPHGQMGNSEVGHMILGCGSVLMQDMTLIQQAITSGEFVKNPVLLASLAHAKQHDSNLHLIGLASDGGVHSDLEHLMQLITCAGEMGVRPLVHMITDGRDTAPKCADRYADMLEEQLRGTGGAIASVCGRYYAMDRNQNWERTERCWQALVNGVGTRVDSASAGIRAAWQLGQSDEFIQPQLTPAFEPMRAQDAVLFFNYRNDRPRQLSEALGLAQFDHFERQNYRPVALTTMTKYAQDYPFPFAFTKQTPKTTLGQVLEQANIAQFHTAETEKYAHVTFFFNGGREQPFIREDRALVPSPDVPTYDLCPQMSAAQVTDAVVAAMDAQKYGLVLVNLANGDMVGHTGNFQAAVTAVETLDTCVARMLAAADAQGYSLVLTADHGNCEMMQAQTEIPHTQHTTFDVPCVVVDPAVDQLAGGCGLASISPTVLQLMGIQQPQEMDAPSLVDIVRADV